MPLVSLAQVTLSGTVVDVGNNALAGVSVRLLNSNRATSTDANGRFSLAVPDRNGMLEFTSV